MWIVSGDIADLIIAITYSGFLYLIFIYNINFYEFIDTGIPGLILSSMFVFLYKELLSFFLFISLNNLLVNPKGQLYYIRYISGLIYSGDLILNIVL